MIHTFFLIIVLLVAFLSKNRYISIDLERQLYILLIFIMIGFRSPYHGSDTIGYISSFMSANHQSFADFCSNKNIEIGYAFTVKLLSHILHFSQALLLVQGAVVAWSLNCFMKRFCKADYFAAMLAIIAFGLLNFHLNGIRQSIAMSICLFAYIAYYDKQYFKGVLLTCFAIFYHTSAFVFLIVPALEFFLQKYNTFKSSICAIPLFCLFVPSIVAHVSSFREKWDNNYAELEETGNGYIFFIILLIISLLFELYTKGKDKKIDFHARIQNITILFWAGRLLTRTFERPAMYFYPAFCALLSNSFDSIPDLRTRRTVYILFVLLTSIFFLYRSLSVKYEFFFMVKNPF